MNNRGDIFRLYRALVDALGREAGIEAIRLITDELGGQRVTVPDREAIDREARIRRMQRLYDEEGLSLGALAERFGMSLAQVKRNLKQKTIW